MPSLGPDYFESLYGRDQDPWNFDTSPYEAEKYIATMNALPHARYRAAFEVGCSIGVLTTAVAQRCDTVLAIDVAESALTQARLRNAHNPHVSFKRAAFPHSLPDRMPLEGFDLILLSEMLYYLDAEALVAAARITLSLARSRATILLVHWLGPTPDYPLTGDQAADTFIAAIGKGRGVLDQHRFPQYRIDLLQL